MSVRNKVRNGSVLDLYWWTESMCSTVDTACLFVFDQVTDNVSLCLWWLFGSLALLPVLVIVDALVTVAPSG